MDNIFAESYAFSIEAGFEEVVLKLVSEREMVERAGVIVQMYGAECCRYTCRFKAESS